MNPKINYTFKSVTGQTVTISSRMGESAARTKAMEHFWGPPIKWCGNRGEGLDLIEVKE